MKKQDYQHHIRYYAPHHFVFYPLLAILLAGSIYGIMQFEGRRAEWIFFAIVLFMIGWLSFMLRQHYALVVQNRVVRLEMRLRWYELTGQRFDEIESKLSFSQLAALRFASDKELSALISRTLAEGLDARTIKRSIRDWVPDTMRV